MAITFNHNDKLYVSGSNVGIGTSTPDDFLQLNASDSGSVYIKFTNSTTGEDGGVGFRVGITSSEQALLWNYRSTPMRFSTADTERMRITEGGNVGIGTTNPPRKLSVETNDTATYSASVNASEISIARKNSSNTAGQVAAISLNATGWSGQTTGVVVLNAIARQGNFSNADFAIQNRVGGNFVETFRITTYGDVGIGTDSPSTKLHIADDAAEHLVLKLEQDNADHQVWFEANSEDGGFARFGIGDNDNDFAFWNTDQAAYHWYMGSLKMILTSGGNLGIGTTNPLTKLHVEGGITINTGNGSSTFNDLNIGGINGWSNSEAHRINFVYGNGTSDIFQTIESYYGGANEGKMRFRNFYTNSAQTGILMTIHSNGNVGIGTDSPQQHLDISAASPTILLKATGQTLGAGDVQGSLLFYNNESSTAGGARVTGSIKQVAEDAFGRMSLVFGTSTTDSKAAFGDPGTYTDSTVERLRIKFNGNVGIGTDSPGSKLHISDATNISAANSGVGQLSVEGLGYTLGIALDSTKAHIYHNSALRNLSFGTNESVDMTIEGSTGNVGIGTASPGATLQVYSTANRDVFISGYGTQAQNNWQAQHAFFTSAGQGVIVGKANANNDSNRLHILYNTSNGDAQYLGYNTSNSNKVKLNTNGDSWLNGGNVGIGTTDPDAELEISKAGSPVLMLTNTSAAQSWTQYVGSNDDFVLRDSTDSRTVFRISGGGDTYFEGGNVGIGTSSPKAALDVNNRFVVDSKTMTMTDSFSDALTVIMSDHTGCYVKITAFGDWGSHSSISYLGEFFLNNGANAYNEPGMIIRQVDGTDTDAIQAQIVDPGSASGNREFIIQLKATATASFTAYLTYTIQGMFVSAS